MAVTREETTGGSRLWISHFGAACLSLGLGGGAMAEPRQCATLDAVTWLIGSWQAESGATTITETWVVASPITLEGRGVTRAKADGTVRDAEDLRLVAMGDGVFYVAKVAHNERPVAFRLTACSEGTLVFENPAHDFPRRLEYRRVDATRLAVHVSDGGSRGFRLDFIRQSDP
jgi:hypothetical protein